MTPTHNSTNYKQSAVEAKQTGCTIKKKKLNMSKELFLTGFRNVYVSIPHPKVGRQQWSGEILFTIYSTKME